MFSLLWDVRLKAELLGHMVTLYVLLFEELPNFHNCQTCFISSPAIFEGFNFFTFPSTLTTSSLFDCSHPSVCEVASSYSFDLNGYLAAAAVPLLEKKKKTIDSFSYIWYVTTKQTGASFSKWPKMVQLHVMLNRIIIPWATRWYISAHGYVTCSKSAEYKETSVATEQKLTISCFLLASLSLNPITYTDLNIDSLY